jgi:hypothetical protein
MEKEEMNAGSESNTDPRGGFSGSKDGLMVNQAYVFPIILIVIGNGKNHALLLVANCYKTL